MKKIMFLAVCMIFMTCNAYADYTISYTDSLPGLSPAEDLNTLAGTLSVSQFNPGLGTLDSVSLAFTNQFNYSVSGQNNDGAGVTFTYRLGVSGVTSTPFETQVKDASGLIMLDNQSNNGNGWTYRVSNLGSGATFSSGNQQSSLAISSYTPSDLSSYIGNGNVLFSVYSVVSSLAGYNGGNLAYTATYSSDPTVTVTYDYTATPIPFAIRLFGSGLLGLLGLKRKHLW